MLKPNIADQADPLLALFLTKVNAYFKQRVIAVFKLGSLGQHGDFSLCSDVDVALVLDAIQPSDDEAIKAINDEIKLSGLEFADRLSVFWSTYAALKTTNSEGRFPALDRLDFIKYAVLLQGIDRREELALPNHQDIIIESAKFISTYMLTDEKFLELTTQPMNIANKGARYFSKFVLFPVRLIFTLNHTGIVDSNHDAVEYFNKTWKEYLPTAAVDLVNRAYQVRNSLPNEPVTINENIIAALPCLYRYCLEQYHIAMLKLEQVEIVMQLTAMLDQLQR